MKEAMSDNERKLFEVLTTLSSFPLNGFENMGFDSFDNDGNNSVSTDGTKAIERFASEQKDVVESVRRILNQTCNLQMQLFNYLFSALEEKKTTQIKEIKQMEDDIKNKMESSKQMTFTPPEILKLTNKFNLKGKASKNTINTHLNNGTLKGKKQKNGTWVVKREDLIAYLGRDDF